MVIKMKNITTFVLFLFIFNYALSSAETLPVPGRLGSSEIATAQFGKNRLFFYMTPEKHEMAKNFMIDIQENMQHGIVTAELDFPINEVTPICTIMTDPIGYDENNQPIYADTKGMAVFENHAQHVKRMIENHWKVHFYGLSKDLSLIINFDANRFHQDQFVTQYKFLKEHTLPIPEYILVQDLTLVDWEMAKGTFTGTILQDEETGDRFIFPIFDTQIACTVYTEPAIYLGPNIAPEYPGANTLPPHCPIAPIDRLGDLTPGSAKGKRVSISIRGLVTKQEMDEFANKCQHLDVNYPQITFNAENQQTRTYPNGLLFKEINLQPDSQLSVVRRLPDMQNVEVYERLSQNSVELIKSLKDTFSLDYQPGAVRILELTKKDGGFSNFLCNEESLNIPADATVVIVNRSKIPPDYCHFPIAEDFTKQGLPWIQLYPFPLNMAVTLTGDKLKDLSITPVEEIIYRDGRKDIENVDPNIIHDKFAIKLILFVFY